MFGAKKTSTVDSSRRLLLVEILEARDLIACVKNGTSDSYGVLTLTDLGGRDIKNETFRTKQKPGTLTPQWNEKFSFGSTYNLDTTDDLPTLTLSLFHKAAYSVSETPMGQVSIQLESIDPKGTSTDLWFPLEPTGRMKSVSGEVHIRLNFNQPPTSLDLEIDVEKGETDELLEGEEAAEEEPPNELHVTVIQGKKLPIMDKSMFGGQGSSDPQVRIKIDGFDTQKTKYIRKNLNPVWNEKLIWPFVLDPALSLTVIVEDHNDIKPVADFMGKIAIPLSEFDQKKPVRKWYKLRNKQMENDGVDRGEIELMIHWKFNVKVKEEIINKKKAFDNSVLGKMTNAVGAVGKLVGVEGSDDEADEDEDQEDKVKEEERPKTDAEKEEDKKKDEEKKKELSDIEIKSGDYQIQVHIIEARDLKAENADGTSDPIVFVECFGQKRNTIVVKGVTTCVFDELFIFNLKDLDKEAFEEGIVRVSCYDSTIMSMVGGKNKMIGAYATDATMVYTMNKDHELYRQWVPLMDDEDAEDVGVQGYLKISIQIIGPGEKVKVHDVDAERAAEIARESAAGADIGSLVLSTPTITKEWKFLVVKLYKCEGLPVMDGKVGAGFATVKKAGTDAFCKINVGGGKPLKTKVQTVAGESRAMINPQFNSELWYPISVPSMTQIIKFSVWDKDPTTSELIGNIIERMNAIKKCNLQTMDLKWYNIYGAPEFKQEKLLGNLKKGAVLLAKSAKQTLGADIDWSEYYNNAPDKASSFKGRVLMQFRIADKRPAKYEADPEIKPFRRKIPPLKSVQEPATKPYVLRAMVLNGSELPKQGTLGFTPFRVKITMGIHEISTKSAKCEKGVCRWNEMLNSEPINFPQDVSQLPDIFIYLIRDSDAKPIVFHRLKPLVDDKSGELMGFEQPAKWFLFQEDKSIDALSEDVFPGQVLIKLGFGHQSESVSSLPEWNTHFEMSKKVTPYQVRVHLYQGRNLPAADSNGLCDPYLKINILGKELVSKKQEKTVFPVYYQTLVFDDVSLPEYDSFQYATQVTLRLYDKDNFDSDDYLGTCFYDLKDAIVTPLSQAVIDNTYELPDPKWLQFFFEVPGDSQGEVLALVQLVPTNGQRIPPLKSDAINIKTRQGFIEFVVIGIRDLAPYNFQNMSAPFMEVELNSFGSKYLSATAASKRPNPDNPNFLERIVMPVMLPENSLFSTPLCIKVKDTRLGGYLKPIVGVCQIDLTHKIPWCEATYRPPQTDVFFTGGDGLAPGLESDLGLLPNSNADPVALKSIELQNRRNQELIDDDFIVSQEPVSVKEYINDRVALEDTGAGIFGALNHIDTEGNARKGKRRPEDAFANVDNLFEEDDVDQPPAWMLNRKKLDEELESELITTPFETYPLTRGQMNGFLGSKVKVVGKLKGLVRIIEDKDDVKNNPLLPENLMEQLMKPKKYVVRLYALRAFNLEEMDFDIFGNKAKSDPYLKVSLGKNVFNDRENAINDTVEADLYKVVTLETELPGVSQLRVEVMDKDLIGSDDLIGRTIIDLEDRWFDSRWQEWGEENMLVPGQDKTDATKVRWKTKPIERRSIYAPGFSLSRGIFECYLDIMTSEESNTFPPDDVALPPKQIFEVRVVIWKTKDVPPMDTFEGMSDLYVKVWPEGCSAQETDTHWRCKKGKASFNWRMLFDVELGHNTRAMKFPYLHLQLWDRDLLKWNDCAGEGVIDLGKYYRKAYKKNVAIKLFEKKKGMALKRAMKSNQKRSELIEDTADDIPPPEEGDGADTNDDYFIPLTPPPALTHNEDVSNPMNAGRAPPSSPDYVSPTSLLPPRDEPDSDDDDDTHITAGMGAIPDQLVPQVEHRMIVNKPKKVKKAKFAPVKTADEPAEKTPPSTYGLPAWVFFWRKKQPEKKPEDEEKLIEKDANGQPIIEKTEDEKKEDDNDELKAMVTTFKNMTGLWDIDPEDSNWYHLEVKDKNDPSKVTPMGSICYSIQIWPKDKATVMAVGSARSEPNTNPFLPPPVGRLKFSFNPFVLGSELCGPVLCAKLFCCFLCLAFITLMIFCQPFLNIIINLIFVVY